MSSILSDQVPVPVRVVVVVPVGVGVRRGVAAGREQLAGDRRRELGGVLVDLDPRHGHRLRDFSNRRVVAA